MKLCSILITDEIRYVNDYNLVSIPLFSIAALAWVLQKHSGSRSLPWFFVWTDGSLGYKRKGWRPHWTTPSCQQWQCAQSRCWGRSYSLGCIQLTLLPSKLQKWHWLLLPLRWPVSEPSTHPVINKKKKGNSGKCRIKSLISHQGFFLSKSQSKWTCDRWECS